MFLESLWGEDFTNPLLSKEKTSKLLKKVSSPKESTTSVNKQLTSKKVSVQEKIDLITSQVFEILGKQKDNIKVIYTWEEFISYINTAISVGRISIDTETNNSLDPLTCKLMGLCLYIKGNKQVYIPVNHVNVDTGDRLPNQLTEEDILKGLTLLKDNNVFIVMHNAKFDKQVIKCTCGIDLKCNWDTSIAAKILNENEKASLKEQYILHIDPEQEKYSIEKLFKKEKYEIFPPETFALYAATDAMMTDKLYEYQSKLMNLPINAGLKSLFLNIEMPCVEVVSDMELTGITLDLEYAKRLSDKYHKKLEQIDLKIAEELQKYSDIISAWKLTSEANLRPIKDGKEGKSKVEQLENPINLASPIQLAILLYDILKVDVIDEKSPRGTGEPILKQLNLDLCKLILQRREVLKLLNTYIDALPQVVNPTDGRIHCHFNQYGADTGRFSSSDPNLQNIPSHEKSIRMMFKAKCPEIDIDITDNYYKVNKLSEVLTSDGWKLVKHLKIGDSICGDENVDIIRDILFDGETYFLFI